ncbi:BOI-related E3 ubiquitin-protein ligase 1-like [Canna indica]|uniref:BOI-related E3 ubiquitin-protein ligase 1-like n=1 Tax=Canna indica TaxID=4628 RepID=A0AAQ3QF67_9LILI|nr:BOI-related E3 ubiquitin-protein ligase 1-like [Canna indica]
MAVHSQHPCNFLLLDRGERDRKEMDFPQAAPGLILDPSALLFASEVAPHPRKRAGERIGVPAVARPLLQQQNHSANLFALHPQPCSNPVPPPALVSHTPPLISTGLHLSFEEQYQQQNQNQSNPVLLSPSSSLLSEDLVAHINQQKNEIDRFLRAQEEQLRQGLKERHRRYYRSLLCTAKESAVRRLRKKEAELEQAVRRSAELEDRLARLRTQSMSWQAKAMADQATAASLHAQLQQAAAAAGQQSHGRGNEAPPAEDAESAFVDPDRVEPERACRACREQLATVVLLPCRHLCLCDACDGSGGAAESCPVCHCVTTGSIRVFLS